MSRFPKIDADRILKRAGEIEASEEALPITVDELRAVAGEAGFGRLAVDRAIAEALQEGPTGVRRHPVQRTGLIISNVSTVRSVPIELSSEQLIRAVRLFQPYRDGPVQANLEERQITWRDHKGIKFTVVARGGSTEIRVFLSKILLHKTRWMEWVKTAADQLESLMFLVAARGPTEMDASGRLLDADSRGDGLVGQPNGS